jgi:hypothetical protein
VLREWEEGLARRQKQLKSMSASITLLAPRMTLTAPIEELPSHIYPVVLHDLHRHGLLERNQILHPFGQQRQRSNSREAATAKPTDRRKGNKKKKNPCPPT